MSLLREIKFVLDFHSPTIRTLTLHQYDKNSTNIIVTCMDNGIIKKIDHQSVNAYLKWKKPDGTNVLNDEIVNEDGTITIECSQQMLTADGRITAELCLVDATTQEALHTMPFFVVNKRAAIDDEEITSTSEYGALVNALIDAKSVQEFAERVPELEAAEQQRQDAETLRQQKRLPPTLAGVFLWDLVSIYFSRGYRSWWCLSAAHRVRRLLRWRRRTPGSAWPSPAARGWSERRSCTWWSGPWPEWWPCRQPKHRRRERRSPRPPRSSASPRRPGHSAASSGHERCPRPSIPSYSCRR